MPRPRCPSAAVEHRGRLRFRKIGLQLNSGPEFADRTVDVIGLPKRLPE